MARTETRNGSSISPDRRSAPNKVPTVYFDVVTIPDFDEEPRIKIGESGNHQKRRGDHSKSKFGIKFDVQHLCVVRGTRADEQQVLKHFAAHLLGGEEETFSAHDDVLDYIRWLRDQYFVWVPDDIRCKPIEDIDMVDARAWMPSPERRKPRPVESDLFSDYGILGRLGMPAREVTIDDFYTSPIILNAARQALGRIDVDPASHAVANWEVKATQFFSINDDGLTKDWNGTVWLNPPFSQWQNWVPKIIREFQCP